MPERTREEILQAAIAEFSDKGLGGARVDVIARRAAANKRMIYHYFRSKAEILYAIHEIHINALLAGVENLERKDLHPGQLLRNACTDMLNQIADHPGYVRAFMDHYSELEGDMRKNIRQRRNQYFASICAVIERGINEGCFVPCDVELTAYGFLGMCQWAYKWYPAMHKKRSPESVANSLCDVFLKGLEISAA